MYRHERVKEIIKERERNNERTRQKREGKSQ